MFKKYNDVVKIERLSKAAGFVVERDGDTSMIGRKAILSSETCGAAVQTIEWVRVPYALEIEAEAITWDDVLSINEGWRGTWTGGAKHNVMGDDVRTAHGRLKFVDHGLCQGNDLKDVPCLPDYSDPIGKKHWPHYVHYTDPKTGKHFEGPRPFKTRDERKSYERLTGLRAEM